MASRKLNVLVYNGTGTTVESVKHAIYSLRRILSPNYAVIPVTDTVLLKEPWAPSCALLVFPGGADLGYCRVLNGEGNSIISQYVRRGGKYFGFCAGAYYGCKRCEFEVGNRPMEVIGSRELGFFPGTCRGGAFKGFQYNSESGARAVRINVRKTAFKGAGLVPEVITAYYNGGGAFVDMNDPNKDVEILASYGDKLDVDGGTDNAAVVYCRVGQGAAILTGPHPEFASVNLSPHRDIDGYDELITSLQAGDSDRVSFLKACLTKLGLEVSQESSGVPSLSRLHLSSIVSSNVDDLLCSLEEIISKEDGEEYIKAEHDTFHLEKPETRWSMNQLQDTLPHNDSTGKLTTPSSATNEALIDYTTIIKHIVTHQNAWPEAKATPYFNHHAFYSSLRDYRQTDTEAETWGDYMMYGEVVTSTNTILEKNFKLLSKLPSGFTVTATTQVAGRGRGTNVWVSPPGCLIMSTVINHPGHLSASRPIVFIQYLAAIATVQAIKTYDRGYDELPVKMKWPNDIYARDPRDPASYVKICGILANCAYSAGAYQIVLGIGVNTTNGRPTTSLDALLPPHLAPFRIERLTARILTRLEALYKAFLRAGFAGPLERAYYEHWLHARQVVTLEAEGGVRARIVGVTTDWGMLKAEELGRDDKPTGKMWALQSDENSFDFFRGLVKRKI
ncbi:putative biotin-protein ligase ligase protein [Rosellinia necatrix]|uniref:Putative biotin-protein ligase ligase protein n=1 Tax=Rosellinia necatrix TaxID=77044 RepID=A0A1W2TFJ3_ROSNE|nr:putative biotin-protein ligase ligase protein [Rosellinia necatrix]